MRVQTNFKMETYVILNAAQRYDNEYDINNFFKIFLKSFNVNFYNLISFIFFKIVTGNHKYI